MKKIILGLWVLINVFCIRESQAIVQYETRVTLSWGEVPKITQYAVQVMRGDVTIKQEKVKANRLTMILVPGKYQYRVRSIDRHGREGSWSGTKDLIVQPGPAVASEPKQKVVPVRGDSRQTSIVWEALENSTATRLKVWKDEKLFLEKDYSGTEAQLELKERGIYKYALATVINELVGPFGDPQELLLQEKRSPSAVEILEPKSQEEIQVKQVNIRWKPDSEASRYHVEISKEPSPENTSEKLTVVKEEWVNTTESFANLPEGNFRVTVRAGDEFGESHHVSSTSFRISKPSSSSSNILMVVRSASIQTQSSIPEKDNSRDFVPLVSIQADSIFWRGFGVGGQYLFGNPIYRLSDSSTMSASFKEWSTLVHYRAAFGSGISTFIGDVHGGYLNQTFSVPSDAFTLVGHKTKGLVMGALFGANIYERWLIKIDFKIAPRLRMTETPFTVGSGSSAKLHSLEAQMGYRLRSRPLSILLGYHKETLSTYYSGTGDLGNSASFAIQQMNDFFLGINYQFK